MNARTTDYLLGEKGARLDLQLEKSTEGIVVPTPVIFESEILGEMRTVVYWHGDDEDGKQREFPLCLWVKFFDEQSSVDLRYDVWFVGSWADLRRSRFGNGEYEFKCHREDLQEETLLVCGMISKTTFVFEIIAVGDFCRGFINPRSYIKKERMSPGGVELEF
ncbi:MAG: hypothetical protein WAV16_00295 [Candidatus Moraniibacteriota bacterium]